MKRPRSLAYRVLRTIVKIHLWFWGIVAALCLLYNFINPPLTPLMIQRYLLRGYPLHKRYYLKLEKIPRSTQRMLIAIEDGNFYRHFGFEWDMVRKAYEKNQRAGKIKFGASTISNQLARTMFLTTDRNYLRKYLEVQITVIMEICMTKDRMLELYLNYVEWGKGIYGIDTASREYYGKSAQYISRTQSMKLISVLTNPIKYNPRNFERSRSARQRFAMLQRYF